MAAPAAAAAAAAGLETFRGRIFSYMADRTLCPAAESPIVADVTIPDHGSANETGAERWRETDFAKTVEMLLDAAVRAKLPLGHELGEALVRRRTIRVFECNVVGNRSAGRVPHNVRGALYTAAVLMLEMLEMQKPSQDYAWLRTAMCKYVLAACDQTRDSRATSTRSVWQHGCAGRGRRVASWKRHGSWPLRHVYRSSFERRQWKLCTACSKPTARKGHRPLHVLLVLLLVLVLQSLVAALPRTCSRSSGTAVRHTCSGHAI